MSAQTGQVQLMTSLRKPNQASIRTPPGANGSPRLRPLIQPIRTTHWTISDAKEYLQQHAHLPEHVKNRWLHFRGTMTVVPFRTETSSPSGGLTRLLQAFTLQQGWAPAPRASPTKKIPTSELTRNTIQACIVSQHITQAPLQTGQWPSTAVASGRSSTEATHKQQQQQQPASATASATATAAATATATAIAIHFTA